MNRFISDLHFGHEKCLKFDTRPFSNIEEQDKYIIKNWNETVDDNDDVYILGDISWYNAAKTIEIFKQLRGHLHLIKGNHDGRLLKNKQLCNLFDEVIDYKELKIDKDQYIVLSHYPILFFRNHMYGWIHLYGHVHNSSEAIMIDQFIDEIEKSNNRYHNMFNVGAMISYMNYVPRTLEEITQGNRIY